jgi:hypothetical protein
MPYRSDLSVPCARTGFIGPETNSTAAAVVGLTSVGQTGSLDASADWLDAAQNADGGWGFFPGDPSDPNSTALALQAVTASGRLGEARFAGALGSLLAFQLGCASPVPDRGAFTFPGTGGGPDTFATVQAVPAGMAVGAALESTSEDGPVVDCSPAGTSTTTTSTTTTSTTTTTTAVVIAPTSSPSTTVLSATVAGTSTSSGSGGQLALTGSATADLAWLAVASLMLGVAALLLRHPGVRP